MSAQSESAEMGLGSAEAIEAWREELRRAIRRHDARREMRARTWLRRHEMHAVTGGSQ